MRLARSIDRAGEGLDLARGKVGNFGAVESGKTLPDLQLGFLAATGDKLTVAIGRFLVAQPLG